MVVSSETMRIFYVFKFKIMYENWEYCINLRVWTNDDLDLWSMLLSLNDNITFSQSLLKLLFWTIVGTFNPWDGNGNMSSVNI